VWLLQRNRPMPSCSVEARSKCETRILNERSGEALFDSWYGFIYPTTPGVEPEPVYTHDRCPFCNGSVRLGIRRLIRSYPQADGGEGEE